MARDEDIRYASERRCSLVIEPALQSGERFSGNRNEAASRLGTAGKGSDFSEQGHVGGDPIVEGCD
jgi:hypothetical protein